MPTGLRTPTNIYTWEVAHIYLFRGARHQTLCAHTSSFFQRTNRNLRTTKRRGGARCLTRQVLRRLDLDDRTKFLCVGLGEPESAGKCTNYGAGTGRW